MAIKTKFEDCLGASYAVTNCYLQLSCHTAYATQTLTAAANATDTKIVSIDGPSGDRDYTFEAVFSDTADSVLIGADAEETLDNLIAAINNAAGEGSTYGTGTAVNADVTAVAGAGDTMVITAKVAGDAANSIDTTDDDANLSWGAATMTGGFTDLVGELYLPEAKIKEACSLGTLIIYDDLNTYQLSAAAQTALGLDQATFEGLRAACIGAAAAPMTSGGLSMYKRISTADTNAASVKGSPGQVYSIQAFNLNAAPVYLKLYDKATAPTVGTDVPVKTIMIPGGAAGAGVVVPYGPLEFTLGIAIAITGVITDADTTAVVANEQVINIDYK